MMGENAGPVKTSVIRGFSRRATRSSGPEEGKSFIHSFIRIFFSVQGTGPSLVDIQHVHEGMAD